MHIGGVEYEVQDLRNEIARKADQHEIHMLRSDVGSLEHTVRGLSAQVDGLRQRLSELEQAMTRQQNASAAYDGSMTYSTEEGK